MSVGDTNPHDARLASYLPRLVRAWSDDPAAERARLVDGTLVSADISGFTALAERLQAKGKEGAEELVTRVSALFEDLIHAAERHGGDVLKFRGDALLLLFAGKRHAERACGAASDMQWTIEKTGMQETTVGTVELRMSVGVHSQAAHLFLTESPHRELLIAGPAATRVFELEDLASAGEIVLSDETAALIDPLWVGPAKGDACTMTRLPPGASTIPPPPDVPGRALHQYVPGPLRDHLAVASGEAEHRQVTVAFLKLSQTDAVIADEGPEALLGRLDAVAAAVGRACEVYGMTWLESDIDVDAVKLYLTSGAPATSGEDEEGMLRGLREVLAACSDLTLRAGVNRGHVFTGDIGASTRRTYAVMGDTVNLAARLCGRAEAGEILTTSPVLDRTRTLYETTPRMLRVKGKALELSAHVVGVPLGFREPNEAVSGVLVGREQELEVIGRAFNAARAGRQQVVELIGPPGIGKSRLVGELRTLADDHGFERVEVATDPYSAAEPYGVFHGLLRRAAGISETSARLEAGIALTAVASESVPELVCWLPLLAVPFDAEVEPTRQASRLNAEQSRTRIHQSVETFLDRLLTNPTLVVVEDAHWLDDASAYLLRHLVDRAGARPWLVCVTRRPGTDPLARAHEAHVTTIELEPLPTSAAAALTLDIAAELALSRDDIERVVARAAGNPLFVRELVSAARAGQRIETLPDNVESLLTTRIDTLGPADRLLLRYASVVGPTFDLSLLGEVLRHEAGDAGSRTRWHHLDEFVLERQDGLLAFRHDLVRATAYEGLSYRRRREIHGRVGAALEERLGTRADEEAALLSLHYFEGGDRPRAWHYAVLAGDRASAGFANVVAAELYDRALAASAELDEVPAAEVARVQEALGDVCERFGAYERSDKAYTRARELTDGADSSRLVGKLAVLLEHASRYDDALAAYDEALARLEGTGEVATRAELAVGRAGVLYRQDRFEDAIEWAEQAVGLAEDANEQGTLAHALYLLGGALSEVERDGTPDLERAIMIFRELGDHLGAGGALNNLGAQRYAEGDWESALIAYRESREERELAGDVVRSALPLNNEAEILSDQGRLAEAEPLFVEVERVFKAAGYALGVAVARSNLGRVASRAGRFNDADACFSNALTDLTESGSPRFAAETRTRMLERLVYAGDHDVAISAAETLSAQVSRFTYAGLEATIHRLHGLALTQAGRPVEGVRALERSLEIATRLGVRYEEALTRWALAEVEAPDAADHRSQADVLLAGLGVIALPRVPLPSTADRTE